jgi:hypothetical protein
MLLSALAAVLLFYSGLFAFLFAVPVQVTFTRRGPEQGIVSTLLTGALIVVIHALQVLQLEAAADGTLGLLLLDALMPLGMLAGVTILNVDRSHPWWLRLLFGAAVAVAAAIPSLRLLAQAATGEGPLGEQLAGMLAMIGVQENPDVWLRAVQQLVFNSVGLGLTAAIAATWWMGRGIVFRSYGLVQSLRVARVPDTLVWAVIAGLALVVTSWLGERAMLSAIGWNILLVSGFLYGIQGTGLVQHVLRRRGMSAAGERWVVTVALMLLFIPGINLIVTAGLPLFGLSEVWIDYKRGEQYEGDSE